MTLDSINVDSLNVGPANVDSMGHPAMNARGMTLVEILIVLGIIGFMFTIIGGKVADNLQKAKVKETKIIMSQIANAITVYNSDCGKNPTSLKDLIENPGEAECADWGSSYVKAKQLKDAWDHDFEYQTEGGSFTLKSLGKDGRAGGSKYDKDISYDDGDAPAEK